MIEARRQAGLNQGHDIAADLMAARDPVSGAGFTHEELVDQIGVFFLAGHETTASTVTWALYLLSQNRSDMQAVQDELAPCQTNGSAETDLPDFETIRLLERTRALIKETLRLYPPGPFLPRVALRDVEIGGHLLKRGSMAMISPWLLHRHHDFWTEPDRFDPGRFLGAAEAAIPRGAYIPFGLGPRVCVGAAFATIEASLILSPPS
jgi:cytochrome P450